jgi:CBS domain containing-hemolysin-like protein
VIHLAVAVVGAISATILAAAESCMFTPDSDPPSFPDPRPSPRPRRDRSYRALALARLVISLITGAGVFLSLRSMGLTGSPLVVVGLAVALILAALIEGLGRSIGVSRRSSDGGSFRAVVTAVESLLAPVAALDARLDRSLAARFPPLPAEDAERDATDQFRQIVSTEPTVTRREAQLITGVFSLGDTSVRDVMVPRVDVVGIERSTPWSEVIDRVRSSEHARFPVFDGTLDDVLGLLFAKDLIPSVIAGEPPESGWLSLLRPPSYIPATKLVDEQLRDFQATQTQMTIVVDEYGGTAGIVTIEDILEEIVGEILDEYDEEEPPIEQRDGRRFWISGRLPLDALADAVGHEFPNVESTTVGGLIFERLGRVPRAGEELTLDGFRVVVERVVRRRVQRVYFEREAEVGVEESR